MSLMSSTRRAVRERRGDVPQAWITAMAQASLKVRALLAERRQRIGYERELVAA